MARIERFTFLCDKAERQAITQLAKLLKRNESDAVRFVVSEAARQLIHFQPSPIIKISFDQEKQGDDSNIQV